MFCECQYLQLIFKFFFEIVFCRQAKFFFFRKIQKFSQLISESSFGVSIMHTALSVIETRYNMTKKLMVIPKENFVDYIEKWEIRALIVMVIIRRRRKFKIGRGCLSFASLLVSLRKAWIHLFSLDEKQGRLFFSLL